MDRTAICGAGPDGLAMALLDSAALSSALSENVEVDAALDAYCRARRDHVRLFQALSLLFPPLYQGDSAALAFARDTVVATVARMAPAPRLLAAIVSGMLLSPLRSAGIAEQTWKNDGYHLNR